MVETRFVALLRCDNNDCKEVAAVAGIGKVVEVPNWEAQDIDYEDAFTPLYVKPSPPLIQVPADCPDSVKAELKLAADAQWGDAGAAATHLRIAVERLLDARRIPKTKISKKQQRVRLSLHERIEAFEKGRPEQGSALKAAKWLGNAGAHTGELSRDDIFDMFDIIEKVLDDIYGTHAKKLLKLVSAVNKAKGPI